MDTTQETIRLGKRCFVGNLAWKTSWQDLKDKFREAGNVVYTNVMRDDDGRSKGWGIVEFETPEEALHAIQSLNGAELGGRRILVREDREDRDIKQLIGSTEVQRAPRPARGGGRSSANGGRGAGRGRVGAAAEGAGESSGLQIVVQGIPWSYTWRELKDMFAEIGNVERADVVTSSDGRSRGYGTVKFTTKDAAEAAVTRFHESELEGRRLAVFIDRYQ
ncbi:hypothetical protein VOLCADRAFT_109965 [Volvox carteri f. nagariensis]|uniref:RRM domain-containing protein n=1 Tax=Volvox carteri f. nagariensis TaxID=3068 RepID=D8U9P4_VOLCA|nr:uncharacterized protein VOLCADRAFT_109965 [Volvox carteri f. nagariensis]EFJ43447.1 hypothetical protein VOLCADRAFT_109965 [Volvox carteri f. nagariensis]|eukprot:XP_002955376.1 hypothetical protein VOLCADRAFT_109965 [Volvox carteri f. nagariensis]